MAKTQNTDIVSTHQVRLEGHESGDHDIVHHARVGRTAAASRKGHVDRKVSAFAGPAFGHRPATYRVVVALFGYGRQRSKWVMERRQAVGEKARGKEHMFQGEVGWQLAARWVVRDDGTGSSGQVKERTASSPSLVYCARRDVRERKGGAVLMPCMSVVVRP